MNNLSEFGILEKGEKVRAEWGREDFAIKIEDIEALLQGKRLVASVCGEYVITIKFAGNKQAERKKKIGKNNHKS